MEIDYKKAETWNDFINYFNRYFPKLDLDESGQFIENLVKNNLKTIIKKRDEYFKKKLESEEEEKIEKCWKELENIKL